MALLSNSKCIDCIIDDHLYLGDAKISRDLNLLKAEGITHIVCVAGKAAFEDSFIYHMCHFKDNGDSNMLKLLPSIFEFIDNAITDNKSKIFVHCMAGMSRSPSVIIAYLMYRFKLTLKQAYIYVVNRRQCIRPNYIFLKQLLEYEHILYGQSYVNSVDPKNLRNISGLYKKQWKKELQKNKIKLPVLKIKSTSKQANAQSM